MGTTVDLSDVVDISFNKGKLPSEYVEVESMSSILPDGRGTSSLYVDLLVGGINGCRIRGSVDSNDPDHSLYGARSGWVSSRFGFTTDSHLDKTFTFMHGTGETEAYRFPADTNIHFIDDNCSKPGYCLIDDLDPIEIVDPTDVSSNNLYLYNDNCTPGGDYNGACTIYTAEFYKNQVLVCYPVPCVRSSDNTPGFYDIVNDRFLSATVRKGTAYLQPGNVIDKSIVKLSIGGMVVWTKP